MESSPIAVTGATGRVGRQVAGLLADTGQPTRLLVRNPARAPRLDRSETYAAPYRDGDAVEQALAGVETAFFCSASESEDRVGEHQTFIDAAVRAGVRHLVYLSFLGADPQASFLLARDHGATEEYLRGSGLTWTFLRDSFYAEAFLDFAGADRVIRGPADEGRVAAVAQADVAAVAAHVLTDPEPHRDTAYDLTGPQAVDLDQMAATMTTAIGAPYLFIDETLEEARASRAEYDPPEWLMQAWISTYTAIADGELERVSDDISRLLDRPATRLEDVFAQHTDHG